MLDTLSVADITAYIRELFQSDYRLQDVSVSGEVSNLTRAASGHWYFTLKDNNAQLKCVMWRSSVERNKIAINNGDAIIVHGYISIYEASGVYQLYADRIRPVGVGDLYQQFEQLKTQLEAEGIFDPARKRPIPAFPRVIGVVTSADAAAFQDVQNVLRRRFPLAQVILSPTLVQGNDAPHQICAAIEHLNAHAKPDVIIVCRGGGSIEDLWAFNDEWVARTIDASPIPIISGVGHETDFTIADFAADLRAPTPSAAAEIATPDIHDLAIARQALHNALDRAMRDRLTIARENLNASQRNLRNVAPHGNIRNFRQRIDGLQSRITTAQRARLTLWRERLTARHAALNAASPAAILARGYAIVTNADDNTRIQSVHDVNGATRLNIQLSDGNLHARIQDEENHD